LGPKLIFDEIILSKVAVTFSFGRPFYDFDCIFLSDLFLKVEPDKIYAELPGTFTDLAPLEREKPCSYDFFLNIPSNFFPSKNNFIEL
jgi:hypothetical protein